MKVIDGHFLTEDTEDHYDLINNLSNYAKENESSYLLCEMRGIANSEDEQNILDAKKYFSLVLSEHQELLLHLMNSGYALIQFDVPYSAIDFFEMYFLYKDEIDIPEKYVYCCVVDKTGAVYLENFKTPVLEPPTRLTDIFTPEEIEEKLIESKILNEE